jgi:hypothetical protein
MSVRPSVCWHAWARLALYGIREICLKSVEVSGTLHECEYVLLLPKTLICLKSAVLVKFYQAEEALTLRKRMACSMSSAFNFMFFSCFAKMEYSKVEHTSTTLLLRSVCLIPNSPIAAFSVTFQGLVTRSASLRSMWHECNMQTDVFYFNVNCFGSWMCDKVSYRRFLLWKPYKWGVYKRFRNKCRSGVFSKSVIHGLVNKFRKW